MPVLSKFSLRAGVLALAVLFCFLATPSNAALLNPPGPIQQLPDPFTGCNPAGNCTLLATLAPQTKPGTDVNGKIYYTATLVTSVYNDTTPIPGVRAGAGLDFFYQISNAATCTPAPCSGTIGTTGGTPDSIGRLTASNFGPPDVGFGW